jgi:threonine synthase
MLSYSVSDEETIATIATVQSEYGYVLCPHPAVGVHAAHYARSTRSARTAADGMNGDTLVCVLTAHPAKFAEVVSLATGLGNEAFTTEGVEQ